MKRLLPYFIAAVLLVAARAESAVAPAPDKSGYTFFNPTPRTPLRELSTDRPDQTESPYTVDAGHWQLELDFANFTRDHDRSSDTRTETWNVVPINLKLGLTNQADLQIMFDSYSRERVRGGGGPTTTTRDWGDLTLRLKMNVWGNDGGPTAAAIMPFVKIPLRLGDAGNRLVEGGVILPLAIALPGGCGLGLMTEVDVLANGSGSGRHLEWLNTATVSRDLTDKLGGYVEVVSIHSAERGAKWIAQFDLGLTYAVTPDVQLDAGCNFGLTRSAPDAQPFLGLSIRY